MLVLVYYCIDVSSSCLAACFSLDYLQQAAVVLLRHSSMLIMTGMPVFLMELRNAFDAFMPALRLVELPKYRYLALNYQ